MIHVVCEGHAVNEWGHDVGSVTSSWSLENPAGDLSLLDRRVSHWFSVCIFTDFVFRDKSLVSIAWLRFPSAWMVCPSSSWQFIKTFSSGSCAVLRD